MERLIYVILISFFSLKQFRCAVGVNKHMTLKFYATADVGLTASTYITH